MAVGKIFQKFQKFLIKTLNDIAKVYTPGELLNISKRKPTIKENVN